ncbi:MAG: DUF3014 domain-containing protein, partial [Elusimicrobia bacterium]|nr:DUF3014 domain-containing protein [Elusimicrobiota bacterium]
LVRARLAALSPLAEKAGWLRADDLLERAAAAADLIARGRAPKDALSFLAPRGSFSVVRRGGRVFASSRSWARYDTVGRAAAALDPAAAARTLTELAPLLDEACRRYGCRGSFRDSLSGAIGELAQAPAAGGESALVASKRGIGWAYADPRLEALDPAQKQLLRLGPRNAAAVQGFLRALAAALGPSAPPPPRRVP